MAYVGEPYYAALLTAAAYHGAAHQAPMTYQVIVPRPRRPIECGQVRVEFAVRHEMAATPVVERNTSTGVLRVASAAATALELVGYPERVGYLDNVATVLGELAERVDPKALAIESRRAPVAWVQRLGYLLTKAGADALAAVLDRVLGEGSTFFVPLATWRPAAGAPRDARWRVALNVDVEPEA
jgi:predicted transcriptional regulator of viral defense system